MAAACLLGGSAAETSAAPSALPEGGLDVSSFDLFGGSTTALSVDADRPASVSLSVPRGITIATTDPAGTEIGFVSAALTDPAETSSPSFVDGLAVVDDPAKYATDPAAQACAPGAHTAVWRVALSVLGQTISMPIFVDDTSGLAGWQAYVIRFCPLWQPSASFPSGLAARFISLSFGNISAPTANGSYTWSARVVPTVGRSLIPAPDQEYELRTIVAIPHALTLRATYQKSAKSAVLSGRLTLLGEPEPRKRVSFGASTGPGGDFTFVGPVTTNANGEFTVRRHVERTTRFTATVEQDPSVACTEPSSAPGGCAERIARPAEASASVVLRKATDPKLTARKSDQALARRASLTLRDVPGGWQAFPRDPFFSFCELREPNLSRLISTGEAVSPELLDFEHFRYAKSVSTVFATEGQARTAHGVLAPRRLAKCLVDQLRQSQGVSIDATGPLSFPKLGSQTLAARVVASFEGDVQYFDFVGFRQKRLVVAMIFVSPDLPLPIEEDLGKAVARRARTG